MTKFNQLFLLIVTLLTNNFDVWAQYSDIILPPLHIKSIVLRSNKPDTYTPIIKLGEKLSLSFDDINGDEKFYSYKIEHYDYNWIKSNLVSTDYMTGFATDRIRDFENSFNTLQYYTHYELTIPNQNNRIKISGNYIISILDDNNTIVFSRRFIVYQPRVNVGVTVHRNTNVEFINEKQSVQFVINHQNLLLNNPNQEIKVDIYQNGDWNSVIKNIKPKYIRGSQLLYNYVDGISFWAGNEYLYFETKEIRNATNNIYKTKLENIFNTYLYTDEARNTKPYLYNPDINGNFVLRTIDTEDITLEGDYSFVHFGLNYSENFNNDDIYIYGAFNDWQLTEENKLTFNNKTNLYEAKLLLKQGFYNYTYVTVNKDLQINTHAIEGSYYQTENEYTVIVYFRRYGELYDQVIGFGSASSIKLEN
jgi:type 9 secretion system plug protein